VNIAKNTTRLSSSACAASAFGAASISISRESLRENSLPSLLDTLVLPHFSKRSRRMGCALLLVPGVPSASKEPYYVHDATVATARVIGSLVTSGFLAGACLQSLCSDSPLLLFSAALSFYEAIFAMQVAPRFSKATHRRAHVQRSDVRAFCATAAMRRHRPFPAQVRQRSTCIWRLRRDLGPSAVNSTLLLSRRYCSHRCASYRNRQYHFAGWFRHA
jgi:hypothetical protein